MDMKEMGQAVSYLLQHRSVETKPAGRNIRDEEKNVGRILLNMTTDERHTMEVLFSGMSLTFIDYDDSDVPAIPKGGRVYMLARDLEKGEPSSILASKAVLDDMKEKDTESNRDAAVWFVHLWLVHLDMLYTDQGRSPKVLNRFAEGIFDFDLFLAKAKEHFEDLRNTLDRKIIPENAAFRIFEKASQGEFDRRCRRFVNLMLEAGLLAKVAKDQFQQTLLSAYEIKRNYELGLSSFVADANAGNVIIATDILTLSNAN